MSKKNEYLLIGIGVVVLLLLIGGGYYLVSKNPNKLPKSENVKKTSTPTPTPTYSLNLKEKVKVPEQGEKVKDKDLAVPKIVTQAGRNTESKLRIFDLSMKDDKLVPSKIAVYQDDVVHLNLVSQDKSYSVRVDLYNFSQNLEVGKKRIIEFQATTPGEFYIICTSCGDKKVGKLIIIPKNQQANQ